MENNEPVAKSTLTKHTVQQQGFFLHSILCVVITTFFTIRFIVVVALVLPVWDALPFYIR